SLVAWASSWARRGARAGCWPGSAARRIEYDGVFLSVSSRRSTMRTRLSVTVIVVLAATTVRAQVTKENVPGIANFARVETTVACGGAIKPEAVAELKQRGFRSIFDLQLASERTANIDGEAAAAKEAGMNFIHVPFTPTAPETASLDKFLTEIPKP